MWARLFICMYRCLCLISIICLYVLIVRCLLVFSSLHTNTRMEAIGIQIHWTFCRCIFVNNFHLLIVCMRVCVCERASVNSLKDHNERCKQHTTQRKRILLVHQKMRFDSVCCVFCYAFVFIRWYAIYAFQCRVHLTWRENTHTSWNIYTHAHAYACKAY